MKKILIILLLLNSSLFCQAQKKNAWKTIAIYSGSIITEAIGDGLYDNGQKTLGKSVQAISFSFVLISPFIMNYDKSKWYLYPITYGFLRIAYFDWTYNITRGLPLTYCGNTSLWDKFIYKFQSADAFAMGRVVAISVGISLPLSYIK